MNKACELAIEVLREQGIVEPDGSWWRFVQTLPVEVRNTQESRAVAVEVVGKGVLPWLRSVPQEGDYSPKTPEARILCAFKMAKGIDWKDRGWDKAMFARYLRPAKSLLGAFGDEQQAAEFILQFGEEMKESGLDWGLDAAVRRAWNTKGTRENI